MSAPPDFMARLMAGLQSGMNNPLLNTGLGIMSSAGPSRMPVGLGQALAGGVGQGQQLMSGQLQQAMQQLMLGRTGLQLGMLQDALGQPQQNQQAQPQSSDQQPAPQAPTQQVTGLPPNLMPPTPGMAQATTSQASPQQATAQPNNTSVDPYSDPVYLKNQKLAQVMDMMQPGSGAGYAAAASQRIEYLTKSRPGLWATVPTSDYTKYGVPPQEAGVTWQRNTQTGELKPTGESVYMSVSGPGPNGQYQQGIFNKATGQVTWPANNAGLNHQAGTPLPGQNETYARQVANYEVPPPAAGGRNAQFAMNILGRAQELNPDFNAQNYDASKRSYEAFTTGKQGQSVKSFSVFLDHLQTLKQLATALSNGDVQGANALKNMLAKQTGNASITSFQAAMPIVADEGVKAIVGAGGGEGDRQLAQSVFNPKNSPQQFLGAVGALEKLGAGQLAGLQRQYEQGTYRKDFNRWLSPSAQQLVSSLGGQQATGPKVMNYNPATGKIE